MKRIDIAKQIVDEIVGGQKQLQVDWSKFGKPDDEELTDEQAKSLLTHLRNEPSGILNWILQNRINQ